MRRWNVIFVLAGAFSTAQIASAEERVDQVECDVYVEFRWTPSVGYDAEHERRRTASFHRMADIIGNLLQEDFDAGGYMENPRASPLEYDAFEGDKGTFHFVTECEEALHIVRDYFRQYRARLTPAEAADAPAVKILGAAEAKRR